MEWMDHKLKPKNRLASYYNSHCSLKKGEAGQLIRRVRGTYGGNVSDYAGNRSSWTADMQTIKLVLNAAVSEDADVITADIGNFYLGSDLDNLARRQDNGKSHHVHLWPTPGRTPGPRETLPPVEKARLPCHA